MNSSGPAEPSWVKARLEVPASAVAAVEALLETLGAVAVSLEDARDQPLLEPDPGAMPIWSYVVVSGLFVAHDDLPQKLDTARTVWRESAGFALPEILFEPLADADWTAAWRQHAEAVRFGDRLRIRPAEAPTDDDFPGATVDLAPGLAFGTGGHPTTRGCLARLAVEPPVDQQVIDFGCGSGILALAALALGAERVVAVDHDPQALTSTAENARRNGLTARLEVCQTLPTESRCELLLANVLAGPLITLAPQLLRTVCPGGRVVLSGILVEQAAAVMAAWPEVLFTCFEDDGWVCLDGRRGP